MNLLGPFRIVLIVDPFGWRIDGDPGSHNHHTQQDHANDGEEHTSMVPYRHEAAFTYHTIRGIFVDGRGCHWTMEFRH